MRILVTGGAGYVGSHTSKALAQAGHEPVVFDNLSEGYPWTVRWGPMIKGDLADTEHVKQSLLSQRIDAVMHLAGSAYVGESSRNPRKYFRNNVINTLSLLDAMVDAGVDALIFSSSCTVYGLPEVMPVREDHPQRPISPYGESKLAVERILHWYEQAYGLKWVALRYFNAAGADPEGELGEMHDPETHLIPLIIQAALGSIPAVEVYGSDYPNPDGTAIRDYTHVLDLAAGHIRALEHLLAGGESGAFNLGTGTGHSVRQVIDAVAGVSGLSVPVREVPRRSGDPAVLVADTHMAESVLGWQPRYSTLEDIIETAWNWHSTRAMQGLSNDSAGTATRADADELIKA